MKTNEPMILPLTRSLFMPGDRLCVAISGGADSVALLLALLQGNAAPRQAFGVGISALHVHHGLRPDEADRDASFVEDLCTRLDVPLQIRKADVRSRRSAAREGVEEAARALRYDLFAMLLASGEVDSVLTAHTIEDQAETVLMKLLRGAWTAGLSGIHPILNHIPGTTRGRVLRPLLRTRRLEIEAFLRAHGQPWQTDSTNTDPAFTRNRLRHEILPHLRVYNPGLDDSLGNVADLALEEESYWQTEVDRLLPQLVLPGKPVRGGGRSVSLSGVEMSHSLDVERLRHLQPALCRRILRGAAKQLGTDLTFDETHRLLALCGLAEHPNVSAKSGARLELSGGLRAQRSPRELRLSRDSSKFDGMAR